MAAVRMMMKTEFESSEEWSEKKMTSPNQQHSFSPTQNEILHFNKKLSDLEKKITLFLNADMADDYKRLIVSVLMDYKTILMEGQRKNHSNLT